MYEKIENKNRRNFLISTGFAAGAFTLGVFQPSNASNNIEKEFTHWILIKKDNSVTVRIARTELGQGTMTGLVQLVVEELKCDWKNVKPVYADVNMHIKRDRIFKSMSTGGSRGIRDSQEYIRTAGATARHMLISAASKKWKISSELCFAQNGFIYSNDGKKASYGELVEIAGNLSTPSNISLISPSEWKIMGTSPKRFDIPGKIDGSLVYASDVILEDMLHASIKQSPVFGAKLKSVKRKEKIEYKGLVKIVTTENWVATVADNWWRANEALKNLEISWEESENDEVDSDHIFKFLKTGIEDLNAPVAREDGNVTEAFKNAKTIIESTYESGFLNHATMEPQNATVIYRPDRLDVWCGTQNGESTAAAASETSGVQLSDVYVHKKHAGGGFGRRVAHQDFTKQAVIIAMKMPGIPIRLQWSREEDMQQGRYRPVSKVNLKAAINKKNNWSGWVAKQSDQSIVQTVGAFAKLIKNGIDPVNTRCFRDNPYQVANFLNQYSMRQNHVPPGFWRAVAHTNNPLARESFIDEIAHVTGDDPYEFRRRFLKGTKDVKVLDAVANEIDWNLKTKNKNGIGIAVVDAYASYTAAAVDLEVDKDKVIKINEIVVAIDCGHVVHPDAVKSQIQSGVIWGLSALMHEEITIKEGKVVQSNFHDYPILKLAETPKIKSLIVPSGGFWGGVGEPPIAAVIPAVANAIFRANGERIKTMPIKKLGYKYKV